MKTIVSEKYNLLPEEKQKLLKSLGWGIMAVVATVIAEYLQQFGLPEQASLLAPLTPVIVNTLNKWASENTYIVKK